MNTVRAYALIVIGIAGAILCVASILLAPRCHPGDRAITIGHAFMLAGCPNGAQR